MRSTRRSGCWPRPKRGPWTSFSAHASSFCAGGSRRPRASGAPLRSCWRRRGSSSRSTSTSRARPISRRGAPPWLRASLRAPVRSAMSRGPSAPLLRRRTSRLRPTSCWTASRSWSRRDSDRRRRRCGRRSARFATMRRCSSSGRWPRPPPPRSGTWRAGTRSSPGSCSWPVTPERSRSSRPRCRARASSSPGAATSGERPRWSRRLMRSPPRPASASPRTAECCSRPTRGAKPRPPRCSRRRSRTPPPAARASASSSRAGQPPSSSTASAATRRRSSQRGRRAMPRPSSSSPTGRWPSWSRPASVAGTRASPPRPSSDSSRPRARAAPSGDSGSWRARGRW